MPFNSTADYGEAAYVKTSQQVVPSRVTAKPRAPLVRGALYYRDCALLCWASTLHSCERRVQPLPSRWVP
jgi:hypothetical protein